MRAQTILESKKISFQGLLTLFSIPVWYEMRFLKKRGHIAQFGFKISLVCCVIFFKS